MLSNVLAAGRLRVDLAVGHGLVQALTHSLVRH